MTKKFRNFIRRQLAELLNPRGPIPIAAALFITILSGYVLSATFGTSDSTITSLDGHDRAGTTTNRPANMSVGMLYFNTTTGRLEVANGATMNNVTDVPDATTTGGAGVANGIVAGAGATGTTTTAGGAGGALTVSGGAGGAKTGTGAAAGGAGGAAAFNSGTGGATANSSTSAGGAGGANSRTAGNGGAATAGTGNGGAGGALTSTSGTGGASTGGTGGAAGAMGFTAGTGGASTTGAGGVGGTITVTSGNGGAATGGTGNGGAAGSVNIVLGTGGTSAGGTAGANGQIQVNGTAGISPVSFVYPAAPDDQVFFVATRAYRVTGITWRPLVVGSDGSAVTAIVKKAASGTAIASGTALHSSTADLKGTINTNQVLTLSTTSSDLDIASGTAIGIDVTGTTTAARGVVTVTLNPQ